MTKVDMAVNNRSLARLRTHVRTPIYRNAYALILSSASTSGLGIIYWVLAARYYTTDQVGVNSAAISMMMLISGLSQLNLMNALPRFIPIAGRATRRLVGYAYLSSVIVTVVLSVVLLGGFHVLTPVSNSLGANLQFELWFIAATMAWCIFALQDGVLTGLRQATWIPIENTLFSLAKIVLLILLAASFGQYGIFVSWTVPAVLTLIPINYLIFRHLIPHHIEESKDRAVPMMIRPIVKFIAANYAGSLFSTVSTMVLPVVVLTQLGASANAYFYLAWTIAYSLQLIALNMVSSLTVESAMDEAKLITYSRNMLVHMARLLGPLILIIVIGAPAFLHLFGANYADEGGTLLRLLALSAIPYSINVLYLGFARVRHQIGGIVLVQGSLCILGLGLSYALLHTYGITGVGLGWLVSQTIVALVLIFTRLRPVISVVIRGSNDVALDVESRLSSV